MNKIYKLVLFFLSLTILGTAITSGTVSFLNVLAENLRIDGSSNVPSNRLALLVADTNRDDFGPVTAGTLNIGDFINEGMDDRVIAQFTISDNSGVTSYVASTANGLSLGDGWDTGDPVGLFWFPSLLSTDFSVSPGEMYGYYTDAIGIDGSNPWITPSDGGSVAILGFFTNETEGDLGGTRIFSAGSNLPSEAFANLLVIPEPQTYALILGGLTVLGLLIVRRRRVSVG